MVFKGEFEQLKSHFDQVAPKFVEYDVMFQTNTEWEGTTESMLPENEGWKAKAEETLGMQQLAQEKNIE